MAQPAIAGEGSFAAHRPTVSPNASFQCNRSTAGRLLAPAMAQGGHYLLPGDWQPPFHLAKLPASRAHAAAADYNSSGIAPVAAACEVVECPQPRDRKSTRLNSSRLGISNAVFCLTKEAQPPDVPSPGGIVCGLCSFRCAACGA